jgi:accessory gene regulator B
MRDKIIDIKKRNIYIYGLEVLLLNAGLLVAFLIISILTGAYIHYLTFLAFFIPLRIFAGGYHAKTSEKCFVLSVIMYVISLITVQIQPLLCKSIYAMATGAIFMIIILIFAPLVNKHNELSSVQYARNKIIVRVILIIDLVVFITCYFLNTKIATSELTYICIVGILLLIGKFSDKLSNLYDKNFRDV